MSNEILQPTPADQTGDIVSDPFKPGNETEEKLLKLFADAVAPPVRRLFDEGRPEKPPPATPEP